MPSNFCLALTRHRSLRFCSLLGLIACLGGSAGCPMITIAPECPATLNVGESADIHANEMQPGAIPTYFWEVIPATGGSFDDATVPDPVFTAEEPGVVTLRLSASDRLFVSIDSCNILIEEALDLSVDMAADRTEVQVGQRVTLDCISDGADVAAILEITQTEGPEVELEGILDGVVVFTPEEADMYTFQCVGSTAGGASSEPSIVTVTATDAEP